VFLRRRFTVMIVPDAHARMRRFHLRGAQVAWLAAAAGALLLCALAVPLVSAWGFSATRELAKVRAERDQLADRSAEIDATLATVRAELQRFEQRTQTLATIAGLDLPSFGPAGQGLGRGVDSLDVVGRAELMQGEVAELTDRSALLERRLDTVEQALDAQSERLSRMPTVLPVRGLIGAGYAWRRDPFTGQRQFHRGLDISAPQGTPVRAPADGIVVKSERHQGYGNVLYVSHGDGTVTRYGHLLEFKVRAGQKVERGDVIALVGSTGRSTAPHLHYEVLVGGKQIDPMRYVMDEGLFY
jgi:murein DD-endopeptidase MepM/ murein hydrolase activator NlpD